MTPYWALFFLFFFFFPHQRSSSITCTKPWNLCFSHRSVSRRGCAMFKAEHSADHNREDIQGLRNDAHCKAHKGSYCVASSLTGYCLKDFEANNDKPHSILYLHQPLHWYINAMEHSRLSAVFYRWFWQLAASIRQGMARPGHSPTKNSLSPTHSAPAPWQRNTVSCSDADSFTR